MEQKLTPRRILHTTHYTSHITKYIYTYMYMLHIYTNRCDSLQGMKPRTIRTDSTLCVCQREWSWHLHHEGYHPASSIEKTHHPFLSVLGLKFHEAWSFHSTGPLSPPQTIRAFWMLCCPESLQKVTEDSPRCLLHKPVAATGPRSVCQKAEDRSRKKCNVKTECTSETMLHVVHLRTRTS